MRPSELQTKYQRNMSYSLLCTTGIALGVAFLIFGMDNGIERPMSLVYINDITADTSVSVHRKQDVRPAKTMLAAMNPYAKEHQGFMGFVTLRPQAQAPERAVPKPMAAQAVPEDLTGDDTIFSYSPVAGDDTGLFVGGGGTINALEVGLPDMGDGPGMRINRPVTLVYSPNPNIPPLAEMDEKEGYVEVLLLINPRGEPEFFSCRSKQDSAASAGPVFELEVVLRNQDKTTLQFYIDRSDNSNSLLYVKLEEKPKEYHFAENRLEVLPKWKFSPAVRNGQPVSSFVVIQYHYCNSSDPDCQQLLLKSVIS